jgi:hypothetical protein
MSRGIRFQERFDLPKRLQDSADLIPVLPLRDTP